MSSLGRRTYTNLWVPGWAHGSQDEILQGLEEKSQEPIPMGSWLLEGHLEAGPAGLNLIGRPDTKDG